ncbi:MAG: DUF2179 domain-containing protein [Candidatus Latescibacteria bacterium]|nr:DUF2179 domain-containing protein [Candidatus Latescibacterota bacterium]
MDLASIINTKIFAFIVIPLLIFLARITDVSIGTMRVIFVSRGYKLLAALCGFFEVLIWIFAITQIMRNLTNILYYFAYAGGFATGNYVGMVIEEKIALGNVLVRVISKNRFDAFIDFLKKHKYGATTLDAEGLHGDVKILFTVIPRTDIEMVVSFIKESNPQAFYTIEDVRFVNERNITWDRSRRRVFSKRSFRKGK